MWGGADTRIEARACVGRCGEVWGCAGRCVRLGAGRCAKVKMLPNIGGETESGDATHKRNQNAEIDNNW